MNGNTMRSASQLIRPCGTNRQFGLSLVELMVAVTISLLLLAGVIQIYSGSRQTYTLQDGMSRLQENARYVLHRVGQDIAKSGYLGCADSNETLVVNLLSDKGGRYDFSAPLIGTDGDGVNATDTLTLRFGASGGIPMSTLWQRNTDGASVNLDAANLNYNNLKQFDLITIGDCESIVVAMVTNAPASDGVVNFSAGIGASSGPNAGQENIDVNDASSEAPDKINAQGEGYSHGIAFAVTTAQYFVAESTNSTVANPRYSLYVDQLDPDNELIQGVEDFQVQYGVNTDTQFGADRYVDADEVGLANWNSVVSVRITLRLNTVDPVQAGATIAKTFTSTVNLRNRSDYIPL